MHYHSLKSATEDFVAFNLNRLIKVHQGISFIVAGSDLITGIWHFSALLIYLLEKSLCIDKNTKTLNSYSLFLRDIKENFTRTLFSLTDYFYKNILNFIMRFVLML